MSIKAKPETVDAVSVVIVAPFQTNHDGSVYGPGDTVAVPAEVAVAWALNGWATITDPT